MFSCVCDDRSSLSVVSELIVGSYTVSYAMTRNTHTVIKKDSLIIARGRYIYVKLVHLLAEATAFRQACLTTSRLAEHRRATTAHNYSLGVAEDSCAARENATVRASVSDDIRYTER